jgi:hypothetical protein
MQAVGAKSGAVPWDTMRRRSASITLKVKGHTDRESLGALT